MIESKAAFARRIGINKSNVTRAAQAGRIVLTVNGQVDVEKSLARWQATKGARDDVAARHAENRGADVMLDQQGTENGTAGLKTATTPATDAQPTTDTTGRTHYKAAVLHYENSSIKLEMALRRGMRYPRGLVKREALGMGSTVRAAMERIIDQTAPRLAVMTNELDRRRLIETELRRLRWMVKQELPRSLRRMRAESSRVGAGDTVTGG